MSDGTITNTPLMLPDIGMPVDLYSVVGRSVILFSHQRKGEALTCRALDVVDGRLMIAAEGASTAIDSLPDQHPMIMQYDTKGQTVSVEAVYHRAADSHQFISLTSDARPLVRRAQTRFGIRKTARLATLPRMGHRARRIDKVRWLETDTINFSSGGLLAEVPINLGRDVNLLVNFEPSGFTFPKLILARVCHCYQPSNQPFRVGLEFLVREIVHKYLPDSSACQLPGNLFEYKAADRAALNCELIARAAKNTEFQPL